MFKKILLFFMSVLATLGFLFWRVWLVGNCIEPLNGFFYPDADCFRLYFDLALIAFFGVVFVIAFTDKKLPSYRVNSSKSLGIINIFYALAAFAEFSILFKDAKETNDKFDSIYVVAVLALAVFMVYFGFCMFKGKAISKVSALIPLLVFVYRLGFVFVNSFGILKSSEVVLNIFSLIFCVLFFECFARYNANIKFNLIKKPLLAIGIISPVIIIVSTLGAALAPIFFNIGTRNVPNDFTLLIATAIYIFLYTLVIFSKKDAYKND